MSTGFANFDTTIQKTNQILDEIQDRLNLSDRQHAFHALRSVLVTLRDRLPLSEAVDLGEQLPVLVRGLYYEGWKPARVPIKMDREEFIDSVARRHGMDLETSVPEIIGAVWGVLLMTVSLGEIQHVLNALPVDVRELLPT